MIACCAVALYLTCSFILQPANIRTCNGVFDVFWREIIKVITFEQFAKKYGVFKGRVIGNE